MPLTNRAFQYNDGFFETLILEEGRVRYWPEHQERMAEAATALHLLLPQELLAGQFPAQVALLAQQNRCGALARIKLRVWRAGEGLYTPQTDRVEWMVTAHPATEPSTVPLQAGLCQTVHTVPSPFSQFKGFNSPVYVVASREKASRGLDDLVLLSPEGQLAELTFSNLFWVKDKTLYTPALTSGCLNGVMRRNLLKKAPQHGWQVAEVLRLPSALEEADLVFAGNVTGLRPLASLQEHQLKLDAALFSEVCALL
nr:aminotransferase class IV [Rufibacter sp. SYSU D00308]